MLWGIIQPYLLSTVSENSHLLMLFWLETSEGKILENVSLEVDLNIENFRGLPLKSPWIIICNFPLNFLPWPWKVWPRTCLEIRGFSRVPLKNPWNVLGTLDLDWPLKFNFKVEEPWNSRPQLPSLLTIN